MEQLGGLTCETTARIIPAVRARKCGCLLSRLPQPSYGFPCLGQMGGRHPPPCRCIVFVGEPRRIGGQGVATGESQKTWRFSLERLRAGCPPCQSLPRKKVTAGERSAGHPQGWCRIPQAVDLAFCTIFIGQLLCAPLERIPLSSVPTPLVPGRSMR